MVNSDVAANCHGVDGADQRRQRHHFIHVAGQLHQHVQESILDGVAVLADLGQLAGQVHEGLQRQEGHQDEGDGLQYRYREIALQDFHYETTFLRERLNAANSANGW